MRQIRRGLLLLLLLLSGILIACGSSEEAVAVRHIAVEAKEFTFSPADLRVKVGEKVEIEFKNFGAVEHDFNIEALPVSGEVTAHGDQHTLATAHDHEATGTAVHVLAKAGNMGHLIFTPSQAGEYLITCTVAGHKEAGMVGKLIVTP
ncbi:MAG: cupredoxin domain-containing protein [Caldilineaceae bacterium]